MIIIRQSTWVGSDRDEWSHCLRCYLRWSRRNIKICCNIPRLVAAKKAESLKNNHVAQECFPSSWWAIQSLRVITRPNNSDTLFHLAKLNSRLSKVSRKAIDQQLKSSHWVLKGRNENRLNEKYFKFYVVTTMIAHCNRIGRKYSNVIYEDLAGLVK